MSHFEPLGSFFENKIEKFYLLESFGRYFINSMVHMIVVILSIIETRTYQIHFVPDFDTDFMIWASSESEEVRLDNLVNDK